MSILNLDNDNVQRLLNYSKQELVEMLLREKILKLKYKNESEWLDQLADLLRDMDDDFEERNIEILEEYEDTKKQNKETEDSYFIDIVALFLGENPTYEHSGYLVDAQDNLYDDCHGDIFIYDTVEAAQKDSDENFKGNKKAVGFSDLSTDNQWYVIDQLRVKKNEDA